MMKKIVFSLMIISSFNTTLNASQFLQIGRMWAVPGILFAFSEKDTASEKQRNSFNLYKNIGWELLTSAAIATAALAGNLPKLSLDDMTGYVVGATLFTGLGALIGWKYAKFCYISSLKIESEKARKGARIARNIGAVVVLGLILKERGILSSI